MQSTWPALVGFVALCGLVAASGAVFRPTAWYWEIDKPRWTPPPWVFPVVWSVLYLCIAVAGWLVWRQVGLAAAPFTVYGIQLVLNAAWSACFFGLKRPDVAFADIVLLWLSIAATIFVFSPISTAASVLLVPYLAWVSLAAALNWSIWRRNRGRLRLA